MPKHYLIFIHGIGELNGKESPKSSYTMLWNRLIKQSGLTSDEFNQRFGRIDVVWHCEELHAAEKKLFDTCFKTPKPGLFNPMAQLRNFMTYFVGDVSAYVSEDVNFIRRTVWKEIWINYREADQSFKQLLEAGATYSIVAHSLGTVIAFDYLSDLFDPINPKLFVPRPDANKRPEDEKLLTQRTDLSDISHDELRLLQNGFRHFFSMGSPIALFLMRKGALWAENKLFSEVYNPVREKGREWCNFWDSHDPIAYPVAGLLGSQTSSELQDTDLLNKTAVNLATKVVDIPVETGWIFKAHMDYWKNCTVAKTIVKTITTDDLIG